MKHVSKIFGQTVQIFFMSQTGTLKRTCIYTYPNTDPVISYVALLCEQVGVSFKPRICFDKLKCISSAGYAWCKVNHLKLELELIILQSITKG